MAKPKKTFKESVEGNPLTSLSVAVITTLTSTRRGSVTIDQKIDDHSNVIIRAARDVTIGQKIDQHSVARIV